MPGIPYNRTHIISNAFILLGKPRIDSIDQGGQVAGDADAIYDMLLAKELSHPDWRFATSVAQLSKLAGVEPGFKGFNAAYDKPHDCLAIWQVWPKLPYEIFGDRIWTLGGNPTIQVEYRAIVSETLMPPAFIHYFTYVIAYNLGIGLTESEKVLSRIEAAMNAARAQAMNVNSQERPNKAIQNSPWIANRAGGYGGFWGVN